MEKSFLDNFYEQFVKIDIYGEPVGLYYRGEKTFKTKVGACFTILTGIIIVIYLGVQMQSVAQRKYTLQEEIRHVNEYEHPEGYNASIENIDFAYQFEFNRSAMPKFYEEPYRYIITEGIYISEGTDEFEESLAVCQCPSSRFSHVQQMPSRLNVSELYCFNVSHYSLQGTEGSLQLKYYSLRFSKCTQAKLRQLGHEGECASEEEIQTAILNSRLKFLFVEQQFDEEEHSDPIELLARVHHFTYKSDLSIKQEVFANKNDLTLRDSSLDSSLNNRHLEFYTLSLEQFSVRGLRSPSDAFFALELWQGFEEAVIQRTTDNVFALLSSLGGMANILYICGMFLVSSYAQNHYFESVMSKLFKYQKDMLKADRENFRDDNTQLRGVKEHLYNRLLQSVVNRAPVKVNLFRSVRKLCSCKKQSAQKEFYQKQLGLQIEKYFSIDTMIKRMREVSVLTSLLLNKHQRTLIPFLFQNMVLINPRTLGLQSEAVKAYLKDVLDMDDRAAAPREQICSSLEHVVRNQREFLNTFLLRHLVNLEESDNFEQLLMIDDLEVMEKSPREAARGKLASIRHYCSPKFYQSDSQQQSRSPGYTMEEFKLVLHHSATNNEEFEVESAIDSPSKFRQQYNIGRLKPFTELANKTENEEFKFDQSD